MPEILSQLLDKYVGDEERVGFVMPDGSIIEVQNQSDKPTLNFYVSDDDILKFGDVAVATWHTHPSGTNALSTDDYLMFNGYSNMIHYIVGSDGVQAYQARDGFVMKVAL